MMLPESLSVQNSYFLAMSADILEAAHLTIGAAGYTHCSAMIYKTVAESVSLLRRNNLPQLFFYLGGLFDVIHKPDQIA